MTAPDNGSPSPPSLRQSLKKWGVLTLVNSPVSLFFSPGAELGRITGRPFLDFHSWPQAIIGTAAIAVGLTRGFD